MPRESASALSSLAGCTFESGVCFHASALSCLAECDFRAGSCFHASVLSCLAGRRVCAGGPVVRHCHGEMCPIGWL